MKQLRESQEDDTVDSAIAEAPAQLQVRASDATVDLSLFGGGTRFEDQAHGEGSNTVITAPAAARSESSSP